MTYYHDLITEKSWKALQELKKKHSFILIGGWAVYLYTNALKSRDIDFICDYGELGKFKKQYDLAKNDRLKKYEIHMGEFDIDIYVPFFSDLAISTDDLRKMVRSVSGFQVLEPEALLILKQKAYSDRAGSAKGKKDELDIISLLNGHIDFGKYRALLKKYGLTDYEVGLKKLLTEVREAPEIALNEYKFAKLKKRIFKL